MSVKNSIVTIGNRTRYLPACSAVPQQTASPGAPQLYCSKPLKPSVCFMYRQVRHSKTACLAPKVIFWRGISSPSYITMFVGLTAAFGKAFLNKPSKQQTTAHY